MDLPGHAEPDVHHLWWWPSRAFWCDSWKVLILVVHQLPTELCHEKMDPSGDAAEIWGTECARCVMAIGHSPTPWNSSPVPTFWFELFLLHLVSVLFSRVKHSNRVILRKGIRDPALETRDQERFNTTWFLSQECR